MHDTHRFNLAVLVRIVVVLAVGVIVGVARAVVVVVLRRGQRQSGAEWGPGWASMASRHLTVGVLVIVTRLVLYARHKAERQ